MVEIVSPEWKYMNTEEFNFVRILNVKEQRRLGISRGKTTVPQAPSLSVRIKAIQKGLTKNSCVRADLWCFGPAFADKSKIQFATPHPVTQGNKLTRLRGSTLITCKYNVEKFGEPEPDGYRYADLKIFITRGARVCCRKNHIAFRLSVVNLNDDGAEEESKQIPVVRTSRVSISEKAMCPRESVRKNKPASHLCKESMKSNLNLRKRKRSCNSMIESVGSVPPPIIPLETNIPKSLQTYEVPCKRPNVSVHPLHYLHMTNFAMLSEKEMQIILDNMSTQLKSEEQHQTVFKPIQLPNLGPMANPLPYIPMLNRMPTLGQRSLDMVAPMNLYAQNMAYDSRSTSNNIMSAMLKPPRFPLSPDNGPIC
mmetsp:Transcript_17961/g.22045  ORF Transcript_17961/g.22045 Transcript_17961/m.22045 type:complete len:367 (-) Transcript_17961:841-1941(-)